MRQRSVCLKILPIVAMAEFLAVLLLTFAPVPEGISKIVANALLVSFISFLSLKSLFDQPAARVLAEKEDLAGEPRERATVLTGLAAHLENAEIEEKRAGIRAGRAKFLHRINTLVLQESDIDSILSGIVREVCQFLGLQRCILRIYSDPEKMIEYHAPGVPDTLSCPEYSRNSSVFRQVFETGRHVVLSDTRKISRSTGRKESAERILPISCLAVPLPVREDLDGILVFGLEEPHVWTPEEVALAEAIARQATVAFHHCQVFRRYRELSEQMVAVMDNVPGVVYRGHRDWSVSLIGAEVVEVTGYTAEEFLRGTARWISLIHPADLDSVRSMYGKAAREKKKVLRAEYRVLHKDGSRRWIADRRQFVYDEQGEFLHADGILLDITDRKQAEEDQARLAMAVEQATDVIIVSDLEGTIQYINPAFERSTGYSRGEAVGRKPRLMRSGKQDEAFYRGLWDTLSRGEVWSGHFINRKKDGTLYEEDATISPLRDSSGRIVNFVAVKRDVTNVVSLERQVKMAQRMESVGTLAGGIAHDFNNLLTVIIGYGDMLKSRIANDPKAISDIDEVLRSAGRASDLTRQLLAFARRQVCDFANLDLNMVVSGLVKLLRRATREDIEIRLSLSNDLPTIRADHGQIEQILMNLGLNARDAMPGGGQLLIQTREAFIDDEYVRQYPYMKTGWYAVLMVSDTGFGIDENAQERIFEPFFTTKGPDKGTGLGLAVVYGIVKQHEGFIHVYSKPGKGTTFRIYFPAVDVLPDAKAVAVPASTIEGGDETILLAEDVESVRHLSERTLRSHGYRVLTACDGEEAVAVFRRHGKEIAMAVLDVVMPKKGGKEAYDEMAAAIPGFKVLFMSGHFTAAIHDSFPLDPGVPFLWKPFAPGDLARNVREILDRG